MLRTIPGNRLWAMLVGLSTCLGGAALLAQDPAETTKPATGKGKAGGQKSTKSKSKAKGGLAGKKTDDATAVPDDGSIKFSRDIAPILVGNCVGCHGGAQPKKKFDLSTFNKLMAGGESGKVIVPGKPEESILIQRVKGEDGLQQMPPPNTRKELAEATITKIEQWIKDGAVLDKGIDATATLDKIAPSLDEIRKSGLAKMSPEQRDKKLEETALERWKKGNSKTTPEIMSGKSFVVFSNLPKKRAETLAKGLEGQKAALLSLLGTSARPVLDGQEKISIYVFNDLPSYVEFLRAVENREAEAGVEAHGNLKVEAPYLAAVDPLNGHDETPAKKTAKSKKNADESDTPGRTLPGLLTEQLGVATANASGKPPRYLSLGIGAYLGSLVEGRTAYYRGLREEAYNAYNQGWVTKANEALGGEGDLDRIRAVGFSLVEWLATTSRPLLPAFVSRLQEGQEKLDETIKDGWGASREQFLTAWGGWIGMRYRRR